ncbi:hypothetical protein [Nocardiopsis sp. CNT312]|uniref:hypothetical protein n=1 Tax=Nocardiopsis sp. CNT312 TaxID=1137268 RepID=UPI00048E5AC9|nr:hypothetical protein [Nocardiopsis sp. CNT312]
MPLVYRTLVSVPRGGGDLVAAASGVLSEWLSKRGTSGGRVDFSVSGRYELSNRSRALVVRHDNPEEGLVFLRLITESDKPDAVWRTVATVVVDPEFSPRHHVWIDMRADPRSPGEETAHPPKLDVMPPEAARMLLEAVDAHDGGHPMPAEPRIVRGRDAALVEGLVSAINDPERRMALLATGPPEDVTVADWRTAMASALSRCTGMCAGYVLDRTALGRVGGKLPEGLDIPAGGVRTFLPGVRTDDTADASRHPRMSPATLDTARERERIRSWVGATLSREIRENALETALPEPLRAIDAFLDEEVREVRSRRARPLSAPRLLPSLRIGQPYHDPAAAQAREELEQQNQRLREEVTRLGARVTELSEERQELLAESTDLSEELASAREQLRASRHEARWLRSKAHDAGLFRLAAAPAPRDTQLPPPTRVGGLLEQITDGSALPHLFFTIEDHDSVYELSDSRKEGLWVTRAWEALLALNDYARYQFDNPGSGLGFHSYLRETPDGYQVIPVKRLASQESDYVRNRGKLNEKRMFRVPEEVSPDGRVPMYAHIKLDTEYGICPRLYFYPHLGPGTTNRVYVGYLGRHLPVQQSN